MARVAYTVTATLPDEPTRDRYEQWLMGGHVQAVVAAGASFAQVIRLTDRPLTVQTRYEFTSEAAYEGYLLDHAPRLRAEGLAAFGDVKPAVIFRREVGTILEFDP